MGQTNTKLNERSQWYIYINMFQENSQSYMIMLHLIISKHIFTKYFAISAS